MESDGSEVGGQDSAKPNAGQSRISTTTSQKFASAMNTPAGLAVLAFVLTTVLGAAIKIGADAVFERAAQQRHNLEVQRANFQEVTKITGPEMAKLKLDTDELVLNLSRAHRVSEVNASWNNYERSYDDITLSLWADFIGLQRTLRAAPGQKLFAWYIGFYIEPELDSMNECLTSALDTYQDAERDGESGGSAASERLKECDTDPAWSDFETCLYSFAINFDQAISLQQQSLDRESGIKISDTEDPYYIECKGKEPCERQKFQAALPAALTPDCGPPSAEALK